MTDGVNLSNPSISPDAPGEQDVNCTLRLGNIDAKNVKVSYAADGTEESREYVHVPGNRVCHVGMRAGSLGDAFANVTAPQGLWAFQSWASPAWVEGDHEGLVQMVAAYYGCPVGRTEVEGGWIE